MYFRCNNGGWDKTHEQVEQMPRIDSFELKRTHAWGGVFCGGKCLDIYQDNDSCEISPPRGYKIRLSHKANSYGGQQTFFLCPGCGMRVRYLYVVGRKGFLCRKCAKLNYKSQQQIKDSVVDYWNGVNYVERYLNLSPWPVDDFSFIRLRPGKPKWMHESTYQQHPIRLSCYQLRHGKRLAEDLARLFR